MCVPNFNLFKLSLFLFLVIFYNFYSLNAGVANKLVRHSSGVCCCTELDRERKLKSVKITSVFQTELDSEKHVHQEIYKLGLMNN